MRKIIIKVVITILIILFILYCYAQVVQNKAYFIEEKIREDLSSFTLTRNPHSFSTHTAAYAYHVRKFPNRILLKMINYEIKNYESEE